MRNYNPEPFISSSVEKVINNRDLLTEILLRVPAIHLLKFKCVSKQLLNLISNAEFCLSHTRLHSDLNSITPAAMFLDYFFATESQLVPLKYDAITTKIPSLDYLNDGTRVKIDQSCNGLLLCFSSTTHQPDNGSVMHYDTKCARFYFICNPTTKQFKKVQFYEESNLSVCHVFLAFEPSKSPHYKLISLSKVQTPIFRVGHHSDEAKFKVHIYSSDTNSWNFLGNMDILGRGYTYTAFAGIYYRGAIHFPPSLPHGTCVYFDVETKSQRELPKPPIFPSLLHDMIDFKYFGESGGRLHLVASDSSALEFDILEMALDYSQWHVRYHVNISPVKAAFPELTWTRQLIFSRGGFSILRIVCAEKHEDSVVILCIDHSVLAYNLCHGTSKKLCDVKHASRSLGGGKLLDFGWYNSFDYFDTLFCL